MFFAEIVADVFSGQFGLADLLLAVACFLAGSYAGYLFKFWITQNEKEHQHSLDIKKEAHAETLKHLAKEHDILFSKGYQNTTHIIQDLYGKIIELNGACVHYIMNDKDDSSKNLCLQLLVELEAYYQENKIYFSHKICLIIEKLQEELHATILEKTSQEEGASSGGQDKQQILDRIKGHWKMIREVLPELRKELEEEFGRRVV